MNIKCWFNSVGETSISLRSQRIDWSAHPLFAQGFAMKRHINSLLQRKRADFDDAQNPRQPSEQHQENGSGSPHEVLVRDGYDWLQQIYATRTSAERFGNV